MLSLGAAALPCISAASQEGLAGGIFGQCPGASLAQLLQNRESASVVGRAYLAGISQAPGVAELEQTILNSAGIAASEMQSMSYEKLHERLRARVRLDFQEHQTVKVNGWVLSVTEARLAALVASI
jgi:hypothetical protein